MELHEAKYVDIEKQDKPRGKEVAFVAYHKERRKSFSFSSSSYSSLPLSPSYQGVMKNHT